MRRSCLGIAGVVLAFALAGCGEPAEEGPDPYKGTEFPAIEQLSDNMTKNVKNKSATTKGVEEAGREERPRRKSRTRSRLATPRRKSRSDSRRRSGEAGLGLLFTFRKPATSRAQS